MDIKLYSTHCPRCKVIMKKLAQKGLDYVEITSIEEMKALGINTVPVLEVDGVRYDFSKANQWINQQEAVV